MFALGIISALFMGILIGTIVADTYYRENFEMKPKHKAHTYWGDDER